MILFVDKRVLVVKGFGCMMLAQRRRRWPSITSALGQCIVGTISQCCFNDGPVSKTVGQH